MKTLFALDRALDITASAARYRASGRVQLRDVLTEESAREMLTVLARDTP